MHEQLMIDNAKERIAELQGQVRMYERKQDACGHVWSDFLYNSEMTTEQIIIPGDYSQCHGSDYYPATELRPVLKDRWLRTCKVCGKQEHTYKRPA